MSFINRILLLILGCMLQTLALHAEEDQPQTSPVAANEMSDWRETLDLRRWDSDSFHTDLNHIIENLSTAHGEEQTRYFLDAAELYLNHMLVFEASSVLTGTDPQKKALKQRHAALTDAASLLQGERVTDFVASPLNAATRPDTGFWRSLQAIASADVAMLNAEIENSFVGLGMQSRAVLRAMLPVFTEAAIETGHRAYVDAALRLLDELPDLSEATLGHFLRGRSHQRRGNLSSALEAYFKASEGWDQYAVRGRLAVADMSLANGGRGALLAAQSVLADGAEAWRGGQYELEVLKRLVRVHKVLENEVDALLTLGKLISRFPDSQEVETAKASARQLLDTMYRKGQADNYPLADWIEAHLQLLTYYRYEPKFSAQTELLADYLMDLGATDLATQEYRRAIRLVREINPAQNESAQQTLFRLNLKLAKTQLKAGLASDARITLQMMERIPGTENEEQHAALSALVFAELGDNPALLEVDMHSPSARHLRQLGLALAEEGRWAQTSDAFGQLWAQFPQEFGIEDASMLLIAANRSEDSETRAKVVRSFPTLTDSKPLIKLAESLEAQRPELLPLKSENVMERLKKLENAFENIKQTNP